VFVLRDERIVFVLSEDRFVFVLRDERIVFVLSEDRFVFVLVRTGSCLFSEM